MNLHFWFLTGMTIRDWVLKILGIHWKGCWHSGMCSQVIRQYWTQSMSIKSFEFWTRMEMGILISTITRGLWWRNLIFSTFMTCSILVEQPVFNLRRKSFSKKFGEKREFMKKSKIKNYTKLTFWRKLKILRTTLRSFDKLEMLPLLTSQLMQNLLGLPLLGLEKKENLSSKALLAKGQMKAKLMRIVWGQTLMMNLPLKWRSWKVRILYQQNLQESFRLIPFWRLLVEFLVR